MEPKSVRTTGAALLAVIVGVAACSSDSPTDPPVETTEVAVNDDFFNPQTVTVSGEETLTWTWQGGNPHNVTWDDAPLADSPTQTSGSHQVTLPDQPGEYGYHCTVHGAPGQGMHGSVIVE
jgi:plastocyanin